MYIIKIPTHVNKYNFVIEVLKKLQNKFNDYKFINCTESPINEYTYFEFKGMHYRPIISDVDVIINETNYIDSYRKEKLMNQGFTLQDYIEMCMFFELEKIVIVSKFDLQIDNLLPLVTILICPDGLNELHFVGKEIILNDMIMLLKEFQ